jgi:hypothetical protein
MNIDIFVGKNLIGRMFGVVVKEEHYGKGLKGELLSKIVVVDEKTRKEIAVFDSSLVRIEKSVW